MKTPHRFNRIAIASVLVMAASARQLSAKEQLGPEIAEELLALHNAERAREGVPPLKIDPKLTEAAQKYAEYLAGTRKKGHLADGDPGTRIKATGYRPVAFAENMAKGPKTPKAVVNAWMRDAHRKTILNKNYHAAGFGYAKGPAGGIVWVADFGSSAPNKPLHHRSGGRVSVTGMYHRHIVAEGAKPSDVCGHRPVAAPELLASSATVCGGYLSPACSGRRQAFRPLRTQARCGAGTLGEFRYCLRGGRVSVTGMRGVSVTGM